MMETRTTNKVFLETPLGRATIKETAGSITQLTFTDINEEAAETPTPTLKLAKKQLQEYFLGERKTFDLPLDLHGTDFQQKVWRELENIPFGKTLSYGELARDLSNARAVRAVAAANGKNKLMIFIPCHRVIGSDGSLTGYAEGLWRKKWLLEHEQQEKQQSLF